MAVIKVIHLTGIFFLTLLGTSLGAAGPHGHHHIHLRDAGTAVETKVVVVPVMQFEHNGRLISESEVCEGIMNGTLHWAPGSKDIPDCVHFTPTSTAAKTTSTTSSPSVVVVTVTRTIMPLSQPVLASAVPTLQSVIVSTATTSTYGNVAHEVPGATISTAGMPSAKPSSTDVVLHSAASSSVVPINNISPGNVFVQENTNVDIEFPDGQVDCSEFPNAYGAIQVPWMNLGGWTGIQFAQIADNSVVELSTGITGNECTDAQDGSTTFCSYACPPGYQKSQWPSTQGNASMAVSVGGLKCENGKLHLTNPSLSTTLCIEGTGKAFVANKLNGSACICRTDYPGTEDETIPLQTEADNTYPLTCPDSGTYYQHLGAQTSAEYYVNNKNVPVSAACQWDTDGSDEGNWAPVVIGAETDSTGATWLSIMTSRQNDPSNYQELDFSIELVGDFGGAACFYTQSGGVGYYCSSGSLANFNPNQEGCKAFDPSNGVTVPGCTVQLFSGTATYNLVETA